MLISALYNITSFRRLYLAISGNIAFRWFCFLTIDDEVFDHSTITYFIERIGHEGFKALFASFNQELLRLGLPSPILLAQFPPYLKCQLDSWHYTNIAESSILY